MKLFCNVNIVYGNLKSENCQDNTVQYNLNEIVRSRIRLLLTETVGEIDKCLMLLTVYFTVLHIKYFRNVQEHICR